MLSEKNIAERSPIAGAESGAKMHQPGPPVEFAPRFVVVIATMNRRDLVVQAVQSVLEQTYKAAEVTVVVDGSTDGTAAALRERYPGVRVIEQSNLGRAIAVNTGVAASEGEWICLLDDDDLWHRDKLARTATYLRAHPDCVAVRNPVYFFADSTEGPQSGFGFYRNFVAADLDECHRCAEAAVERGSWDYLDIFGNSFERMLTQNCGVYSATVVRRDLYIRAGGLSPSQASVDDWTFFINVSRLTEWHLIPERLGFTRLHGKQVSQTDQQNGFYWLIAAANSWHTGRALPQRLDYSATLAELSLRGPRYREAVQRLFWGAFMSGRFRLARSIRTIGKLLLPRLRDRLYVLMHPSLTWRIERYILGMHK